MMKHVRVVGFAGKMGSGRSTVALLAKQYLTRVTDEPWHVVAFSDSLKTMVAKLCDVPVTFCYSEAGKAIVPSMGPRSLRPEDFELCMSDDSIIDKMNEEIDKELGEGVSIGRLLQIVGEAVRTYEPNYWVDALENKMEVGSNYIVDGGRTLGPKAGKI